jgi:GT2 family glycosyltransferase
MKNLNMNSNNKNLPPVSLVIITKDRREELSKCLSSLSSLDYPEDKLEIIVVEEADKPKIIQGVKYIHIPRENRGWGYARNIGIKNSSHEIIGFIDDDCIVTKEWLKILIAPFSEEIGGVTGGVRVKDSNVIGYCENVLGFPNGGLLRIHNAHNRIRRTIYISTCNCLYKKEIFQNVGNFYDAKKTRGTDSEFAARATQHYKCLFVPQAIVYHKPRRSIFKIFKWFVSRGRSQITVYPLLPNKKRHLFLLIKNSLAIRAAILALILYLAGPIRWFLLLTIFIIYYLYIFRKYSFQFRYLKRWDTLFLTPIVKLAMDIGMEVGILLEWFRAFLKIKKRNREI